MSTQPVTHFYPYSREEGLINQEVIKMTNLIFRGNLPAILRREFAQSPFVSLDTFFEEALNSFPNINAPTVSALSKSNYPKVNIVEEDDKIVINAAVPGLTKEDINIEIEEDVLTISGEKQEEDSCCTDEAHSYLKRELHRSSFRRGWILHESLDQNKISAEVKEGILSIIIPKLVADSAKKKTIKVK